MRLEDLPVGTMREALRIYLDMAWEDEASGHWPPVDWETCSSACDVLASFKDETGTGNMRKYSLRLGNKRYPFMKVVFQELLIHDSFYFAVDTHDDLDLKDSFQDYEQWLAIKNWNSSLKERVERAWREAGVPTFASLVAEIEGMAPVGEGSGAATGPLVLVVDDEPDIAHGVETILNRRGYATLTAASGEEALELVDGRRPALILSDLEMKGMTGLELAARLRKRESTRRIPFILATAASIATANFKVVDGFLVKPFDRDVLIRFVEQHLQPDTGDRPEPPGASSP